MPIDLEATAATGLIVNKPREPPVKFMTEVYPSVENRTAMDEVYKAYMRGTIDLESAARLYDVPWNTVKFWARNGKWVEEKASLDAVEISDANRKLALARARQVNDIVDRTVQVQAKVTKRAEDMLDSGEVLRPGELKSISEAAKNASDNSLRAVGIGESGATVQQQAEEEKKSGKRPLVMVFQGGGLPPVRRSENGVDNTETIVVESQE